MTISSELRRAGPYTGDGVATSFPFYFKVFSTTDVLVIETDTLGAETPLTLTGDYAVSFNANQDATPGGSVTMTTPLAADAKLTILSQVAELQPVLVTNAGGFYPRVFNDAFDRVTILVQQIAEKVNRAILAPVSDDNPAVVLPALVQRVGKFLAFDALGNLVPASGTGSEDSGLREDLAQAAGSGLLGFKPSGTGALLSSVYRELSRQVWVDQYGAKGDYDPVTNIGTNDAAAFALAIAALGGSGTVLIPRGFRCLIASNLAVPKSVTIEAISGRSFMRQDGLNAYSGDIYIDPAVSITLDSAAGIRRCVVFRRGIQFAITSAQVTAQFQGSAFILKDYSFDTFFEDVTIGGFLNGIQSQSSTLGAACDRTRFIGRVSMDNINCVRIYNAYDVAILDGLHCWPFITFLSPAEVNGAQFKRAGYAVWLHGVNDWTKIQNAFNYGYKFGFRITDARSVTLINCGSDYPYQSTPDESAGCIIEGTAAEARLIGFQAAQRDSGIYIASTSPLMVVEIVAPNLWENRVNGVAIAQGDVQIVGGSITSTFAGAHGVETAAGAGDVTVTGMDFRNIAVALANFSASTPLTHRGCTFNDIGMVNSNPYITRAPAADPMILPYESNGIIIVNGNTSFGNIGSYDGYVGRQITLLFEGTLTVGDGGTNLKLNGNFSAIPGSTLTLVSTGTYWVEVARSIN